MKHRKLRIAWSVAWGLVAVLLIVLWVRSYGREGILFERDGSVHFRLQSSNGVLSLLYYRPDYYFNTTTHGFSSRTGLLVERMPQWLSSRGINLELSAGTFLTYLPYGYLLPFVSIIATFFWIPWPSSRFSLRTLLIATTLVAVMLGLIVWLR